MIKLVVYIFLTTNLHTAVVHEEYTSLKRCEARLEYILSKRPAGTAYGRCVIEL